MPLVVRLAENGHYETVGGAQRLAVLMELGAETVPCVIVEADDAEARLLAQVLNHVHGDDDLGLRAENFRHILETHSQEEVLAILPETAESLKALVSLGEADLSQHLQAWQAAQAARLRHMTIQLLPTQLEGLGRGANDSQISTARVGLGGVVGRAAWNSRRLHCRSDTENSRP